MLVRRIAAFAAGAIALSSIWIIRNLIEIGQPLGPRFEGGTTESLTTTIRLALNGTAHIVVGDGWSETASERIGFVIIVAIAVVSVLAVRSRRSISLDVGIAAFAATSFVIPIIARRVTANDIELRVMSPMLIPVVYFATLVVRPAEHAKTVAVAGATLLCWWVYQGAAFADAISRLGPRWQRLQARSSRRRCTTSSTPCLPTRRS